MKPKWSQFSDEELQKIVKENTSFLAVQRILGYSDKGGSATERLKKVFDEKHIDYSHFKGHAWNKKITLDQTDFPVNNKQGIRELLLKEREYKCENCGIVNWQNQPIILEIHHIDGNSSNNIRSNLMLLCPNCHSQTKNYRHYNQKNVSDEDFLNALKNCPSICSACKAVGLSPNQNNYKRARKLLKNSE